MSLLTDDDDEPSFPQWTVKSQCHHHKNLKSHTEMKDTLSLLLQDLVLRHTEMLLDFDLLLSVSVHRCLEVTSMYGPQQDVYRIIQLLPHHWFRGIHSLQHLATDFQDWGLEVCNL
jgi:hypothetical protein